jgi:hypothetical protein
VQLGSEQKLTSVVRLGVTARDWLGATATIARPTPANNHETILCIGLPFFKARFSALVNAGHPWALIWINGLRIGVIGRRQQTSAASTVRSRVVAKN